jgi:hypothetical protein
MNHAPGPGALPSREGCAYLGSASAQDLDRFWARLRDELDRGAQLIWFARATDLWIAATDESLLVFDPEVLLRSGHLRHRIALSAITDVTAGRDWFEWYVRVSCSGSGEQIRFNTGAELSTANGIRDRLRTTARLDEPPVVPPVDWRNCVLFLHGVGGAEPRLKWLSALNAGLGQRDHPLIDPALDLVIDPDYSGAMGSANAAVPLCPTTWTMPEQIQHELAQAEYSERRHDLWQQLKPLAGSPAGTVVGNKRLAAIVARTNWGAPAYLASPDTRRRIWQSVLDQLPSSGRLLIIGYSLAQSSQPTCCCAFPSKSKSRGWSLSGRHWCCRIFVWRVQRFPRTSHTIESAHG